MMLNSLSSKALSGKTQARSSKPSIFELYKSQWDGTWIWLVILIVFIINSYVSYRREHPIPVPPSSHTTMPFLDE